jgi:peptidoglycan/LPS O-acetylase OafA/YrhL
VYLGRISYTVYLIHGAFIVVMRKYTSHSSLAWLLALGITILYATLSWLFIEKPILNGGRRKVRRDAGCELIALQNGTE